MKCTFLEKSCFLEARNSLWPVWKDTTSTAAHHHSSPMFIPMTFPCATQKLRIPHEYMHKQHMEDHGRIGTSYNSDTSAVFTILNLMHGPPAVNWSHVLWWCSESFPIEHSCTKLHELAWTHQPEKDSKDSAFWVVDIPLPASKKCVARHNEAVPVSDLLKAVGFPLDLETFTSMIIWSSMYVIGLSSTCCLKL